jgi:hypothetical protein
MGSATRDVAEKKTKGKTAQTCVAQILVVETPGQSPRDALATPPLNQAAPTPLSTNNPSLLSVLPTSSFVVTPLAALANDAIAALDNGGRFSSPGGGLISAALNFAVRSVWPSDWLSDSKGIAVGVLSRDLSSLRVGVDLTGSVVFRLLFRTRKGDLLCFLARSRSSPILRYDVCQALQ